jgi:hypothetical protein
MLITFKSKKSPNLLMYQKHVQTYLDLLGKNPERGVISTTETARALEILEKAIADSKLKQREEQELEIDQQQGDQEEGKVIPQAIPVDFSARVYPLLEMLRTAQQYGHEIIWGV